MIVHIVRHPRSKPETDTVDDAQRQVTKKAAKRFKKALKLYKDAGEMNPSLICCGPETRNMQSAEIARDVFNLDPSAVVQTENLSPAGDPKKALTELKQYATAASGDPDGMEVMLIGSNPAVAGLFSLLHGLGTPAGQSGSVKMKKGSVVKMKVRNLGEKGADSQLRSLVTPGLAAQF